eukprot:c45755_g1_i1.p1 GENE.c45755_g1_i1~~c45755_g1_i1.p1  ORF type:complete len:104 (-),score=1.86 c45755_g1_i1:49-360(-)
MDIRSELAFYGAYHSNHANQLVHAVFVPLILWSAFLMLGLFHRSLSFFLYLAYAIYYIYLDLHVGAVAALFYALLWYSSDHMVSLTEKKRPKKDFYFNSWICF